MPEPNKPLSVLVLSDGRPGHYNQSMGIVRSLEFIRPVEFQWAEVSLRLGLLRKPLKWLLNRFFLPFPIYLLRLFYRLPQLPQGPLDIIVSAGGKTSFLNAALARHYRAENVFAGSLRGLSPELFSVVLTLEAIAGARSNIVVDLAPTVVDPADVAVSGDHYRQEKHLEGTALWAMIIGGDGAGYAYTTNDWHQLVEGMATLAENYRIRWLVTTSRRTGQMAEKFLESNLPAEILADGVWYGREPRQVMSAFLGAAETVFCTEDSLSMLTEAVAAGRPVISLAPKHRTNDRRYQEALERLADRKLLHRTFIETVGQTEIPQVVAKLIPLKDSVSRSLAQDLKPVVMKCKVVE